MKEKIRPIYSELQGYLSQAPPIGEHGNATTSDDTLWRQFNVTIEELNKISGEDFNKFRVTGMQMGSFNSQFIYVSNYRQKLGGLISHLHAKYFSDELPPFSGMPSTIINQTQAQNQSISIILNMQEKILSEISKHPEGSKERTFLEKIKSVLPTMKTGMDILSNILKIGSELGLNASEIHKTLHF